MDKEGCKARNKKSTDRWVWDNKNHDCVNKSQGARNDADKKKVRNCSQDADKRCKTFSIGKGPKTL